MEKSNKGFFSWLNWICLVLGDTVDGRDPAPVDMVSVPSFTRFHTCWVVQDFFHQQYFTDFTKINHHHQQTTMSGRRCFASLFPSARVETWMPWTPQKKTMEKWRFYTIPRNMGEITPKNEGTKPSFWTCTSLRSTTKLPSALLDVWKSQPENP